MKFGRRKQDEVEVADAVADDIEVADTSPEVDIATDADADHDEVDAVAPTDKSARTTGPRTAPTTRPRRTWSAPTSTWAG
ncbi:hypothetical protein Q9Q99_02165 [Curtobacterium flaccumfaciens]|nr:hypothetical protein Q9Q99_02165 [Curtobacterium flaccumfaciens]